MITKLAIHHKFDHWTDYLSPLEYARDVDLTIFSKSKLPYRNPEGKIRSFDKISSDSQNRIYLCDGSIHLDTHPLAYGTIPYTNKFHIYRILGQHTTGYSAWDQRNQSDLVNIAKRDYQIDLKYFMHKRFIKRFNKLDESLLSDEYKSFKEFMNEGLYNGSIIEYDFEPYNFWIERDLARNPRILEKPLNRTFLLALNWCNMKSAIKMQKIYACINTLLSKGFSVKFPLHNNVKRSVKSGLVAYPTKIFGKDYWMNGITDIITDGSGLGYEAYRYNQLRNNEINVYNFEEIGGSPEFAHIQEMGTLPSKNWTSWNESSRYPSGIISEIFDTSRGMDIPRLEKDLIINSL